MRRVVTFVCLAWLVLLVLPSGFAATPKAAGQKAHIRSQIVKSPDPSWKAGLEQQSTTTYNLSGTVTSAAAGAVVNLSGSKTASVIADSSGNYTFTGLSAGSYVVVPVLAGHTFTPGNKTVTIGAPPFVTTTTQTAETGNNTSASSTFTPVNDLRAGVLSQNYEAAPTNVSTIDAHSLVYPGFNGLIMPNVLMWFDSSCTLQYGGIGGWSVQREVGSNGGHFCNGQDSASQTQAQAVVDDILRRGFNGATLLWESYKHHDSGIILTQEIMAGYIRDYAESKCVAGVCPFKLAIQYDNSGLQYQDGYAGSKSCSNGATINVGSDEDCIIAHLKDDFCYLNAHYFGSPAYLKVNGHPMWQSFIGEGGYTNAPAPSWKDAWIILNGTFLNNMAVNCPLFSSLYNGAFNNGQPALYFGTGSSAFTHDGLTNSITAGPIWGAYPWENLSSVGGVAGQNTNVTTALSSLNTFFSTAVPYNLVEHWGAAWPGFNDQLAGWSPNYGNCALGSDCTTSGRVTDRACGMTWINSLAAAGAYYNTAHQLPYLQIATWNDYDEGTEIETGIKNCYTLNSSISGSVVSYSLTTTNTSASLATVDHFTIYGSLNGSAWGILFDSLTPALSATKDLQGTNIQAGTYSVWVKMVGKNSIQNKTRKAGTFTVYGGSGDASGINFVMN